MKKVLITITLLATTAATLFAEEKPTEFTIDSQDSTAVRPKRTGLAGWWDNLVNGNVDRTFEKPIDMSFGFAPYYSEESNFGFGGQLSALFRLDRTDSIMQPSDFSLQGGGSLNGTYSIGINSNVNFTRNDRLNCVMEFTTQHRDFWGIDFWSCYDNPATQVHFHRVNICADYQHRVYGNWFVGTALRLKYAEIDTDKQEYLMGQSDKGFFAGLGLSVMYDSRDFILNPKKGMLFFVRHIYYPYTLGKSDNDIGSTTLQFDAYHRIWEGAVMAYDVFAETNISNGELPWQLREEIDYDGRRMRGYYSGRYVDNNQVCVQAELRQHIYKRFGAVAWGGAGMFFKELNDINKRQILPNYGVGIRFEMKKNSNIRVDFGFGRNASAIMFYFGEAF